MTRGSGRAIVTVSGLDPEGVTASEAEWLLRDHGLRALTIDTSIEDSFADVHDLLLDVDVADADVVISLGGRSATALAIAVLCDVPMSVCGSLDARRLGAVQQAVSGGSELHRSVLDVDVGGIRRFTSVDLEVIGSAPLAVTTTDRAGERTTNDVRRLRVGPERPSSGRLWADCSPWPAFATEAVRIDDAPEGSRIALDGRGQRFRQLGVRVHPRPLREVVVGSTAPRRATAGRRWGRALMSRPVVDTEQL